MRARVVVRCGALFFFLLFRLSLSLSDEISITVSLSLSDPLFLSLSLSLSASAADDDVDQGRKLGNFSARGETREGFRRVRGRAGLVQREDRGGQRGSVALDGRDGLCTRGERNWPSCDAHERGQED